MPPKRSLPAVVSVSDDVNDGRFLRHRSALRTIWRLAGDQQAVLLQSVGLKALQAAFEAAPAALLVFIINRVRQGTLGRDEIVLGSGLVIGCVLGQWCFGYLSNRSAWIATFELFGTLRARLLEHVRLLPMSFHDEEKAGNVVTVLTQDVSTVESFTHEPLQVMIAAAVAPCVVCVVLLFQDVPMACATFVSVVLAFPAFRWSNSVFVRLAKQRQSVQAEASSRMIEYIQGLKVVRAFGLAGERLNLFRTALQDFQGINREMARRLAPLGSLFLSTVFLGIPLVLFVGTYGVLGGRLDAALFLIFAVLSLRVYLPLIAAAQGFESLRMADASLDRIAALLSGRIDPQPASGVVAPKRFDVEFEAVGFSYAGKGAALDGVSFVARQGAVTALVGPSGAGKSTILQLIAGLRRPTRGTVRIGGVDQQDLSRAQLFDAITPVFQDVYLFPGTIAQNIALGRENAALEDVEAAARAAHAHEFISRLPDGYATVLQESGGNLSGGERQRVAIARAILKDAPIVLLDEFTSALDASSERRVQQALAALVADRTVLVVAHRLATIRRADHIVVLEAGRAVQQGTHDQLLREGGCYAALWAARQQASDWRIR